MSDDTAYEACTSTIRIIYNGKSISLYNHYDSHHLSVSLTKELITLLEKYSIDELKTEFEKLTLVTSDGSQPTVDEIERLKKYQELDVSNEIFEEWMAESSDRWYSLLHKCQGSLIAILESGYAFHLNSKKNLREERFDVDEFLKNYAGNLKSYYNARARKNNYDTMKDVDYEYVIDLDAKKFNSYNLTLDDLAELDELSEYLDVEDIADNYLHAKKIRYDPPPDEDYEWEAIRERERYMAAEDIED